MVSLRFASREALHAWIAGRFVHPECKPREIYLGNFTTEDSAHIGWRSKRKGTNAFCNDGTPYPYQDTYPVAPYFIARAEVEEAIACTPYEDTKANFRKWLAENDVSS